MIILIYTECIQAHAIVLNEGDNENYGWLKKKSSRK